MKIITRFKKLISNIFLLTIMFSGTIYASPYISILLFKYSIDREDIKSASSYINFPSVRESIKSQLKLSLDYKLRKKIDGKEFSELGMMIFNPLISISIDSIVDSTVTIKGLDLLLNKGILLKGSYNKETINLHKESDEINKISLYYKDINTFILSSKNQQLKEPIKVTWHRDNLFKWRLSLIKLPNELLQLD